MQFQKLSELNKRILREESCSGKGPKKPVINKLRSSQKFLIISLEPSLGTDKSKPLLQSHSGFADRVMALFYFGSDSSENVKRLNADYGRYKDFFLDRFYWTHYSKCYTGGNPGRYWADKYLLQEIDLFEPELIIVFGNRVANFLFGRERLISRVNRVLEWRGIPVICSLHPSRDWNLQRREEYKFKETWSLIRTRTGMDKAPKF